MIEIDDNEVIAYYKSYEKLFHNSKEWVSYYRRLSLIVNWIYKKWVIFLLPIIPLLLELLKFYEILELPPLVNVADSYFFSWWIGLIIISSIVISLITGFSFVQYGMGKNKIIRKMQYPFCLIMEAYYELKSFIVNRDNLRLEQAVNNIIKYIDIERSNQVIIARPFGDGNVLIGLNHQKFEAVLQIDKLDPWIKFDIKTIELAKSFDYFFDDLPYDLANEFESLTAPFDSVADGLLSFAKYEYAKLMKDVQSKDFYINILDDFIIGTTAFFEYIGKTKEAIEETEKLSDSKEDNFFVRSILGHGMSIMKKWYINLGVIFIGTYAALYLFNFIVLRFTDYGLSNVPYGHLLVASMAVAIAKTFNNQSIKKESEMIKKEGNIDQNT